MTPDTCVEVKPISLVAESMILSCMEVRLE